jgi:hypothetical protein
MRLLSNSPVLNTLPMKRAIKHNCTHTQAFCIYTYLISHLTKLPDFVNVEFKFLKNGVRKERRKEFHCFTVHFSSLTIRVKQTHLYIKIINLKCHTLKHLKALRRVSIIS